MPKPNSAESKQDFVTRCIPIVLDDGTAKDNDQATAICHSIWEREREKTMTPNEQLLAAIRSRKTKATEFAYGILTCDRYVATMADRLGLDTCYRLFATRTTSFQDILQKASEMLVYSNQDMDNVLVAKAKKIDTLPGDIQIPKNTLMVFKHTLTSTRKDRDGDVLHADGMVPDPKMLLLWQHMPTCPIGKFLGVQEQNENFLKVYSCIVDMNDLCHDAAVMIDNDMGRFSHGFRALEFEELKTSDGKACGFNVKKGEIMEESLVSVPANIDAQGEEVLLSLVEGGKLTSSVMKSVGQVLREKRPAQSQGIAFATTTGDSSVEFRCTSFAELKQAMDSGLLGKGESNEDKPRNRKEEAGGEGQTGAPGEENGRAGEGKEDETTGEEMKQAKYYVPYACLEGSSEWVRENLHNKAPKYLADSGVTVGENDWISVIATYSTYVVLQHEHEIGREYTCYKASWELRDKEPVFTGPPKEVKIEISTQLVEKQHLNRLVWKAVCEAIDSDELKGVTSPISISVDENKDIHIQSKDGDTKMGRVLSRMNEAKIKDAREDVIEAGKMDGVSRPCRALLRSASNGLGDVLSSLESESSEGQKDITVKSAMAYLVANATRQQRENMISLLNHLNARDKDSEIAEEYRAFMHG